MFDEQDFGNGGNEDIMVNNATASQDPILSLSDELSEQAIVPGQQDVDQYIYHGG